MQHFHKPLDVAARDLEVCSSVLKRTCRAYGIKRWPYRVILRRNKMVAAFKLQNEGELAELTGDGMNPIGGDIPEGSGMVPATTGPSVVGSYNWSTAGTESSIKEDGQQNSQYPQGQVPGLAHPPHGLESSMHAHHGTEAWSASVPDSNLVGCQPPKTGFYPPGAHGPGSELWGNPQWVGSSGPSGPSGGAAHPLLDSLPQMRQQQMPPSMLSCGNHCGSYNILSGAGHSECNGGGFERGSHGELAVAGSREAERRRQKIIECMDSISYHELHGNHDNAMQMIRMLEMEVMAWKEGCLKNRVESESGQQPNPPKPHQPLQGVHQTSYGPRGFACSSGMQERQSFVPYSSKPSPSSLANGFRPSPQTQPPTGGLTATSQQGLYTPSTAPYLSTRAGHAPPYNHSVASPVAPAGLTGPPTQVGVFQCAPQGAYPPPDATHPLQASATCGPYHQRPSAGILYEPTGPATGPYPTPNAALPPFHGCVGSMAQYQLSQLQASPDSSARLVGQSGQTTATSSI